MKSPPFLYVLSQAVGEPGRFKVALFASFFTFVFFAIAMIFGSLIIKGYPPLSAWSWFSHLLATLLTLGLTLGCGLALAISLTLAFGTKTTQRLNAAESVTTRLWGVELVRVEHSPPRVLPSTSSEAPVTGWSTIAFANRKTEHSVGAVGILEAALWNLHARNLIEISICHEIIRYLKRYQASNSEVVHVRALVESAATQSLGFWETKLLEALTTYNRSELELFDLILVTYGDSSASPFDRVIELSEANTSSKELDSTQIDQAWNQVRSHIRSSCEREPPLEALIQERIRIALKNRVSV